MTARPVSAKAQAATGVHKTTPEDLAFAAQALTAEYGVLVAALGAVWSASLVRTSIFLGVLSAAGVALGFAAQTGPEVFTSFAQVVVPLALFLGLGTFIRTLELQRESIVYITGMNRIRHFFLERAPGNRRYYILPDHDDEVALFRSQGTGMYLRPHRSWLMLALVQMQGIVAIVCGLLAAATTWLLIRGAGPANGWLVAGVAFLVTVAILLFYWSRSLGRLRASIRPINPTPPEAVGGLI